MKDKINFEDSSVLILQMISQCYQLIESGSFLSLFWCLKPGIFLINSLDFFTVNEIAFELILEQLTVI